MLREVADPQLRRGSNGTPHRRKAARKQPDQGRLAVAVRAQQRDPVVVVQVQRESLQHRRVAVADRHVPGAEQRRRSGLRIREPKDDAGFVPMLGYRFHPFQHLQPRLRLSRLGGLVPEPRHELLDVGTLRLLARAEFRIPRELHAPGPFEAVIAALVELQLRVFEMQDLLGHAVQEIALVTDDEHGAAVAP